MRPTILEFRVPDVRHPGRVPLPEPVTAPEPAAAPARPPRAVVVVREAAWAIAAGVVFVSLVSLPRVIAAADIDPSWVQTLALLAQRGATPGTDFVFAYGPLYYLVQHPYDPANFWTPFAGELLFKAALTLLLVRLARRLRPDAGAGLLLVVTAVSLANLPTDVAQMTAALAAVWLPFADDSGRRNALLGVPFLAAAGLAKFTLLPFAVVGLAVLTAYRFATGRRWAALAPAGGFAVVTAGLWVACGHSLARFPAYVRGGFEYTSGYSEALALPGPALETRLALLAAGLTAAWAVLAGWGRLREPRTLAGLALLAFTAAVTWKHGFVRHDAHPLHFFTFALVATLLLPLAVRARGPVPFRGLLWAAGVVAAVGCHEVLSREKGIPVTGHSLLAAWKNRAGDLLHPLRLRERLDNDRRDLQARFDLPGVRARVGAEPIDVFTESQGVALLNGLNLAPRPTLQSLNACSRPSAERNREYLVGPHAPRFVLLKLDPIDGRYPTLADGPALLELARRYRPVLRECGFVLLERLPDDPPGATEVAEWTVGQNEPFAVPDGLVSVRLEIDPTAWGAARTATFRTPELYLDVRDDAGTRTRFRISPGMTGSEFLLSPLCPNAEAFAGLSEGAPGRRVVEAAVAVEARDRAFFRPAVRVTLTRYPAPRP